MVKRIAILSDTQFPYENGRQVKKFIEFVGAWQPDELVCIGDVTDYPTPSRWSKGTKEEFAGSVKKDSEYTKRKLWEPLRAVYSGPIVCHIGNHDERPWVYLRDNAPALADTERESPFYYGNLVGFDEFGITDPGDFYRIAPGWESTHGHKVAASLSQNPGSTALNEARNRMKSIICGHTHRLGAIPDTIGVGSAQRVLWGMEVGNMMDMAKAGYLKKKGGYANWQSGFGVLYVDGNKAAPVPVPMAKDGTFIFEGRAW